MRDAHGCLYCIDFDNGKSYIGISLFGIEKRMVGHRDAARRNAPKTMLHRAMAKYGLEAYVVRVLVICDDFEYLKELETRAIRVFRTKAPSGYNMTDGGDGQLGKVWSQKSREKLAAWKRGRRNMMSPASRTSMIQKLRSRVFSEDHRRKLAEAGRRRKPINFGPMSAEHKAKIAAAHVGIGHSLETRAKLSKIVKEWWQRKKSEECAI